MKYQTALYENAVVRHYRWLDKCVDLIDGTKVRTSPPTGDALRRRAVFSGYERIHCLLFQTLTTHDGLIFHMNGPIERWNGDRYVCQFSNIDTWLRDNLVIMVCSTTSMETKHTCFDTGFKPEIQERFRNPKN